MALKIKLLADWRSIFCEIERKLLPQLKLNGHFELSNELISDDELKYGTIAKVVAEIGALGYLENQEARDIMSELFGRPLPEMEDIEEIEPDEEIPDAVDTDTPDGDMAEPQDAPQDEGGE